MPLTLHCQCLHPDNSCVVNLVVRYLCSIVVCVFLVLCMLQCFHFLDECFQTDLNGIFIVFFLYILVCYLFTLKDVAAILIVCAVQKLQNT